MKRIAVALLAAVTAFAPVAVEAKFSSRPSISVMPRYSSPAPRIVPRAPDPRPAPRPAAPTPSPAPSAAPTPPSSPAFWMLPLIFLGIIDGDNPKENENEQPRR